MRLSLIAGLVLAAFLNAQPKDAASEAKGLPPRTSPTEYLAHTKAGDLTIAAEFKGHSVPTPQGTLTSEEYVVVEVGLFGAPDAHAQITATDFSLRINGKKSALPAQPYGMVTATVKDPEWEPPAPPSKGKTGLTGGGGGGGKGDGSDPNAPPEPVKIPLPVQRAMAQRVQKATLPEGDRVLPQAGLLYFQYRGKASGIHSVELIYAGPAGKATLALQP